VDAFLPRPLTAARHASEASTKDAASPKKKREGAEVAEGSESCSCCPKNTQCFTSFDDELRPLPQE
jgi:hypothetical protein